MPSLLLFHRRTLIGGDDLQIPSLLTILVRLFQLTFLLLPLYFHIARESSRSGGFANWIWRDPTDSGGGGANGNDNNGDNNDGDGGGDGGGGCGTAAAAYFPLLLTVHVFCTTIYSFGTIHLEAKLYRKSAIGAPTQPQLRYPAVSRLLEIKLVPVAIAGMIIWLVGVVAFSFGNGYYSCLNASAGNGGDGAPDDDVGQDDDDDIHRAIPTLHPYLWWYALILLLLTQFAEIVLSVLALVRILTQPKWDGVSFGLVAEDGAQILPHHHRHQHHELSEEMWSNRCRSLCQCLSLSTCFLFGGRDVDGGDYTAIARALADYFEHGDILDLVPSDLVAGFIMLQRVQRERVLEARRMVIESERTVNLVVEAAEAGDVDMASPMTPTTISSLRDSAVKRSAHESIFAGSSGGRPSTPSPSSGGSAAAALSRTSSTQSFGPDPLSPMPDPTTPAPPPPDRATSLSEIFHPSALAFRMEHTDTRTWYETTRRSVLCRNDEDDRAAIAEGARFSRHALAIYTWVLYVYMHPIKGTCTLACAPCGGRTMKGRRRSSGMRRRRGSSSAARATQKRGSTASDAGLLNDLERGDGTIDDDDDDDHHEEYSYSSCPVDDGRIIGDNCCHVHRASLLAHAGLEDSDLVYAQLNCSFKETPYCILIDHRWKTVVLAIRGTLSIEDCVVDVLVDPESLEELGKEHGFDAEGQACHSGALFETQWIYQDLKQHGILDRLLLGPNAEYPHYNLRIVGHSLGACCACLLSFMMKRQYPSLRCLCYSPPGGFMTWKMATECKDFVNSFVLDADLVPRLSVDSMEHLRNEVLELIGRIKVPKIEVLEHAVSGVLPRMSSAEEDPDVLVETNARILHPKGCIPPETEFARQLERVKAIQSERRKSRSGLRDVPLYPPGRICHLVKTGETKSCRHGLIKCLTCFTTNAGSEYTAVWIENDDLNEIVVSPTMGTDHFPDRVCLEIEGVATNFGIDTSLGSTANDRENALLSSSRGGIEANARLVSDAIFP